MQAGKVKLVDDGEWVIRGVRYMMVPGHTPGHSVVEIHNSGKRLVVVADSWFTQVSERYVSGWNFVHARGLCTLT